MRITGIIAEYNPFHNGHKYQIDTVRQTCDAVVVIMSGSMVQRGDVAVFDKWARTKAALANGADLVIELPVCFALSCAERFAYGAVYILNALGTVDNICFGSECGDIDALRLAADAISDESVQISARIKQLMDSGMSYPSAREKAFDGIIPSELLREPNNILAIEYLRALKKLGSTITPFTVARHIVGHNSSDTHSGFASASAIRAMLYSSKSIADYVPRISADTENMYRLSYLDTAVTAFLRTVSSERLRDINDVSEGLENRIILSAKHNSTIDAISEEIKTKRYTMSRIRRILLSSLIGLDKNLCAQEPSYIRVLGMSKIGCALLSLSKRHASLPIITKTADFDRSNEMFRKDILSTDISALCCDNPSMRVSGRDFTTSPIIFKETLIK